MENACENHALIPSPLDAAVDKVQHLVPVVFESEKAAPEGVQTAGHAEGGEKDAFTMDVVIPETFPRYPPGPSCVFDGNLLFGQGIFDRKKISGHGGSQNCERDEG